MIKQRKIELLAPAKNLECGIEAINHGADAVYIGAPKFGARAAAVNSLEDIEALVKHAHLYNARIYVTVNTILKEEELKETEEMIHALYRVGVDALIVQNPYAMGYLGVETAANLINGQTGGPSVIDTATTIVTERTCTSGRARRYCFLLKRKVIDPVQNLTITISKV